MKNRFNPFWVPIFAVFLLCAFTDPLWAVTRSRVMENAARFCFHEWSCSEDNTIAGCGTWTSDYDGGESYVGLPYAWGGWMTLEQFDSWLAQGMGAGSHSSHGVISCNEYECSSTNPWCTIGLDCSGYVSQAWETSIKYGTSTFHEVSYEISRAELQKGDALNKAGTHIVLFYYESEDGRPVFYESSSKVKLTSTKTWSYLSSYMPIRYDDIEDDTAVMPGVLENPIQITSFPFTESNNTGLYPASNFNSYNCDSARDESGPEVFYKITTAHAGQISISVLDGAATDVDIYLLSALDSNACLARDDAELSYRLNQAGTYYLVVDTYASNRVIYAGPYTLTVNFTPDSEPSDAGHDLINDTREDLFDDPDLSADLGIDPGSAADSNQPNNDDSAEIGCNCRFYQTPLEVNFAGLVLFGIFIIGLNVARRRKRDSCN